MDVCEYAVEKPESEFRQRLVHQADWPGNSGADHTTFAKFDHDRSVHVCLANSASSLVLLEELTGKHMTSCDRAAYG